MPVLHTPASFSGPQCRRDALPPRPAPIRTRQPHKDVVSGSLSPRDAFRVPYTERELLVVDVTQKLWELPDYLSVCFGVTLHLSDQC